jgi:hypothetical protein
MLDANFQPNTAQALTVSIAPGSNQIQPVGTGVAYVATPIGGLPPYRYYWTFETASASQSEVRMPGTVIYGAQAAGADAMYNGQPYAGPANTVTCTITDSLGTTASDHVSLNVLPTSSTGPVTALPGLRLYKEPLQRSSPNDFNVYIPSSYNPQTPMPVMFNVNKDVQQSLTEFQTYADQMGFIVVNLYLLSPNGGSDFYANLNSDEQQILNIVNRVFNGIYLGSLNIDRQNVLFTGVSGGAHPTWYIAPKHPDIFTQLCFRSGNFGPYQTSYYGLIDPYMVAVTTWQQRPIYQVWGQYDRANVITENGAASTYLINQVQAHQLTQLVVAGGGHASYPDKLAGWWDGIIPKIISASSFPEDGGTISGAGAYAKGASATMHATPSANYSFVNWTVNGVQVSNSADYPFVVSTPRALVANFHYTPPLVAWQASVFGGDAGNTRISGDAVVNNAVGMPNLMAYALGMNPYAAVVSAMPFVSTSIVSGTAYLRMSFNRNATATDITYCVEANSDLSNPGGWTPVSTCSANGWTPAGNVSESGSGAAVNVQVLDTVPQNSVPKRFLRLKVIH